jgi:hypothetical protein
MKKDEQGKLAAWQHLLASAEAGKKKKRIIIVVVAKEGSD